MALGKLCSVTGGVRQPQGAEPSSCEHPAGSRPAGGGSCYAPRGAGAELAAGSKITFLCSAFVSRTGRCIRQVVNISFGLLIAYLSVPVVLNLLSSRQVMNTSFNPLRIVNTYGAFGRYSHFNGTLYSCCQQRVGWSDSLKAKQKSFQ